MEEKMDQEYRLSNPSDSPPINYQPDPIHEKMVQERDVMVPMRDGIRGWVEVYRPDSPEKFPARLAFAMYNKEFQGPEMAETLPPQPAWSSLWTGPLEAGDTKFFVSRGYIVTETSG